MFTVHRYYIAVDVPSLAIAWFEDKKRGSLYLSLSYEQRHLALPLDVGRQRRKPTFRCNLCNRHYLSIL